MSVSVNIHIDTLKMFSEVNYLCNCCSKILFCVAFDISANDQVFITIRVSVTASVSCRNHKAKIFTKALSFIKFFVLLSFTDTASAFDSEAYLELSQIFCKNILPLFRCLT